MFPDTIGVTLSCFTGEASHTVANSLREEARNAEELREGNNQRSASRAPLRKLSRNASLEPPENAFAVFFVRRLTAGTSPPS